MNIAYAGFDDVFTEFLEEKRIFQISDNQKTRKNIMAENGLVSGLESFVNQAQYTLDQIRLSKKIVEVLTAEARLKHSAGLGFEGYSDAKVAKALKK